MQESFSFTWFYNMYIISFFSSLAFLRLFAQRAGSPLCIMHNKFRHRRHTIIKRWEKSYCKHASTHREPDGAYMVRIGSKHVFMVAIVYIEYSDLSTFELCISVTRLQIKSSFSIFKHFSPDIYPVKFTFNIQLLN